MGEDGTPKGAICTVRMFSRKQGQLQQLRGQSGPSQSQQVPRRGHLCPLCLPLHQPPSPSPSPWVPPAVALSVQQRMIGEPGGRG
jgi:hypothetical protein